jgi:Kef-type K+ transport system membrane component KefB
MFIVGMDLEVGHVKRQARTAVLVSQVGLLFPFLLGVGAALFLFPEFAAPRTTLLAFALFLGISLSLTAFPVLARILSERGLMKTALGSTAIACAAMGDVSAWCALAFVVAVVRANELATVAFTLGLVVLFVAFMLWWVKPRTTRWLGQGPLHDGAPASGVVAGAMVLLFASALATEVIGIHALFGAFLAGAVMPPWGEVRDFLKVRLEHFTSSFLLPLFFAYIGLRTHIGSLSGPGAWLVCGALILLATLGKLGGTMLAARLAGVAWIDAFALGALMNTRGLVELVALNVGYDLGILPAPMFTMLVVMALVTTGMTAPLLSLCDYLRSRKAERALAATG